ncbi:MAG: crotonase/enoyl-CoA hydratase family protein [Spirochaetota bacterium]
MTVKTQIRDSILLVTIQRPQVRNAVDGPTARELFRVFTEYGSDPALSVAILTGEGEHFCAGADLKALSEDPKRANPLNPNMGQAAPMGPTRLMPGKPVIAAISGYAVAGGLELACWCDLRIADHSARFGVFSRRFGVPFIDGGTQRLPRLIGLSRSLDLMLTGRELDAKEALHFGLVNRLTDGNVLTAAIEVAERMSSFPQECLRNDRFAMYNGLNMALEDGLKMEFEMGLKTIESGETEDGAKRFTGGEGKHGSF